MADHPPGAVSEIFCSINSRIAACDFGQSSFPKSCRLLIAGIFLSVLASFPVVFAGGEMVSNFSSGITIQKNGVVFVTETITYDFASNQKHGIFRIIPLQGSNGPVIDIGIESVTDQHGNVYPYTSSYEGGSLKIEIGNPNELVGGIKTYLISYTVWNAIRNFADHDELYWNVTGNDWPTAMRKVNASVSLPQIFPLSSLKIGCFAGHRGSGEKACAADYSRDSSGFAADQIGFNATRALDSGEGLTIAVGFPTGTVPKSSAAGLNNRRNSNSRAMAPFFTFSLLFFFIVAGFIIKAVVRKGKPQLPPELKTRPLVVEYGPPANLTPIDTGAIFDGNLDNADLASVIIDLAVRGYLRIRYVGDDDYEFGKLKDLSGIDHPAYKIMFNFLFVSRDIIKLSELEEMSASLDRERVGEEMQKYLQSGGYLKELNDKDPAVRKYYISRYAAIFLAIFGVVYAALLAGAGGFEASGAVGAIVLAFFSGISSALIGFFVIALLFGKSVYGRLAEPGVTALGKIIGFKEFLRAVEADKFKLLSVPEMKPELFDRYLPYAMVLGVEKEWAKKFDGIYTASPAWFEGPAGASFNAGVLVGHLSSFSTSFKQATMSSSGFSGGHSGGGSGGGSGGSW